ncbi:DUF6752 domain-containing protein [Nocardioides sp. YIM 152588]|uniref:DUF6752 domain-containing protein n=1 Tax=Nocardioides sp. YIM 152588 TaxID=3158259 RepID=UPI0032E3F75C
MAGKAEHGDEPLTGGRYLVAGTFRRMVGLAQLEKRVQELEEEVAGYRATNVRVAELVDLVQELLLPAAQRDEAEVARLVERYADELGS